MKKIIFGSASAILAVIGFSAFKTAKSTATSYYWFELVNIDQPLGNRTLTNPGASFIKLSQTITAATTPCDEVVNFQCIVGFTEGQIFKTTGGAIVLKTAGVVSGAPAYQTSKVARITAPYVRSI